MLNVNNWVGVGVGNWVANYSNIRFSIVLDENALYDVTAVVKIGNADFFNQISDIDTLENAKLAADAIAVKAYNLSSLTLKKTSQDERDAQAKRSAAIKKYSEASRQHAMFLMSLINTVPPKLNDFLSDSNYVWIPRDPSGRQIDVNNLKPRTI